GRQPCRRRPPPQRRWQRGAAGTPRPGLCQSRGTGAAATCHDVGRTPVHSGGRGYRSGAKRRQATSSNRRCRGRGHSSGLSGRPVLARVLVLIFAVVVIGAAAGIAYFVLGDSTPLLGAVSISDPMAPVDPSDSSKQSVTVPPGATAADIGNDL